jgi:hypothetical protein
MKLVFPKNSTRGTKVLVVLISIILLPILFIGLLLYLLCGIILYVAIWLTWRQRFVLFVYSNSPIWKDYLEANVIPKLQNHAVILNWSQRKTWKNSLAVLAFRYFGGYRNFNPLALVFRPFRFAKAYRYFEAFRDFKHGKIDQVEKVTQELLNDVEE